MLARLGHRPFVGGDDQECSIHPAPRPASMFSMKSICPRHIDDTHRLLVGQRQPGEAQVDGHLTQLLFAQPVGVDAG